MWKRVDELARMSRSKRKISLKLFYPRTVMRDAVSPMLGCVEIEFFD